MKNNLNRTEGKTFNARLKSCMVKVGKSLKNVENQGSVENHVIDGVNEKFKREKPKTPAKRKRIGQNNEKW